MWTARRGGRYSSPQVEFLQGDNMADPSNIFPTDPSGLPEASAPRTIEPGDGGSLDIRIAPVAKRLGSATVRLLAYNGSVPGPTIQVRQGSRLAVHVTNEGDLATTVHWHGLRLENRYDGTTLTQEPVPVGGRFTYLLDFPDPGVYWYHPHIREDYGQEMGLYGNIVVVPSQPDYWPPAHREIALTLDDLLVEGGKVAPFDRATSNYTAMGRFGNILLVNGQPDLAFDARVGEVVRLYLTATANTRHFNVGMRGARMKLIGGDSGRCEKERFVETVLIAPSERAVVDVLFERPGSAVLEHRTPGKTHALAMFAVRDEPAKPSLSKPFEVLRVDHDLAAERERLTPFLRAEPDKTLALVAEMDMGTPDLAPGAVVEYFCPMHADVIESVAGKCPKCGMKLLARPGATSAYACPMHPEVRAQSADHCPKCGMKLVPAHLVPPSAAGAHSHGAHSHGSSDDAHARSHGAHGPSTHSHGGEHAHHGHTGDGNLQEIKGIEWEDDMVEVNRMTTPANTQWKLIDRANGAEGAAIDWRFRVGERVKIRLVNEMDSDHPMQHPFHVHGAGRFLVLARDGAVETNLVWKDTVLVPTGQTVDILLDVTNPGVWMAHCHIAEHHESGMMFRFRVDSA